MAYLFEEVSLKQVYAHAHQRPGVVMRVVRGLYQDTRNLASSDEDVVAPLELCFQPCLRAKRICYCQCYHKSQMACLRYLLRLEREQKGHEQAFTGNVQPAIAMPSASGCLVFRHYRTNLYWWAL